MGKRKGRLFVDFFCANLAIKGFLPKTGAVIFVIDILSAEKI